jgi:hypothetical protein
LRPWYKLRAKTVFRDLSCLPAGSSLEAEVFERLDRSKHLIVLASPEAAVSRGMEIEAQYWFNRPRSMQVLIIVSSGKCETWEEIRTHLLPSAVRDSLTSEPLWAPLQHRRERPRRQRRERGGTRSRCWARRSLRAISLYRSNCRRCKVCQIAPGLWLRVGDGGQEPHGPGDVRDYKREKNVVRQGNHRSRHLPCHLRQES